ncbi:MAG: desulfoferrodoxin Dfx [Clostridiales bacterium]|nr:desulfoferrodoxin Dfx [Clostridiales bacterium]
MKFYVCGQGEGVALFLTESAACSKAGMRELIPGQVDAAQEKHLPVRLAEQAERVSVSVGQTEHPMEEKHWIQWVVLETDRGAAIRYLDPGRPPRADFALLPGEQVKAVYAYCNLHGLWKA